MDDLKKIVDQALEKLGSEHLDTEGEWDDTNPRASWKMVVPRNGEGHQIRLTVSSEWIAGEVEVVGSMRPDQYRRNCTIARSKIMAESPENRVTFVAAELRSELFG